MDVQGKDGIQAWLDDINESVRNGRLEIIPQFDIREFTTDGVLSVLAFSINQYQEGKLGELEIAGALRVAMMAVVLLDQRLTQVEAYLSEADTIPDLPAFNSPGGGDMS